jgi:thiol:disulfide interchange protein DsbD
MKKSKIFVVLFFALLMVPELWAAPVPGSPFRLSWDAEVMKIEAGQKFYLKIGIRIPEGHYLYAGETEVDFASLEGLMVSDIDYPEAVKRRDDFGGGKVDAYEGDIAIGIAGYVPEGLYGGLHELSAKVKFKGCSPTVCFRSEEHAVVFLLDVKGAVLSDAEKPFHLPAVAKLPPEKPLEAGDFSFRDLFHISDFGELMQRGLGIAIAIVFLAGVLTSLTPCVWPVIPAVLLFVGVHPHKKFSENIVLAACLALGIVLVYSVLGMFAVAFGKNLGFLFQQRWFLVIVVLFFVAMSLSMFGLFNIRVPRGFHAWAHRLGGEGYLGAFLAGLGLGLVASPCAGPVLAALLGYVALQQNYTAGFALLFVYSLGFGMLFVVLGGFYAEIAHKLRGGPWLLWVKRTLGILLLFPAAFYMSSLFSSISGDLPEGPRVEWLQNESDALKFAKMTGRPVIVEFTARWCSPCNALEKHFFTRPEVVRLSYRLVPLKVDATVEKKETRRLIKKYGVAGWPTIIFLGADGEEYKDLRVVDYDLDLIRKNMKEAVTRSGGTDDGKTN